MGSFFADVKLATRLLWKEKAFAATALATLALCIGANTAVFGMLHSIVLKPLPVPESDRILHVTNSYPKAGVERASNSAGDYFDRRAGVTAFEEVAMFNFPGVTVGEKGAVERVQGAAVTPSFFRLLRAQPVAGRVFTDDEGEEGNERKVILSHALWQKLYGGDRSAVGKDLRIAGIPHSIVGVMPEEFFFLRRDVALWRPLAFSAEQKTAHHSNNWEMIGRLKPGATLAQAQSQIDAVNAANLERFPEFRTILTNAGFHTRVSVLQEELVREIQATLYLLWGAVLFVLLIGAVNICNLALARSSARVRELATRLALGAGRWRLLRQLVTESVVLTALGAGAGLILGAWGLRALRLLRLDGIPRSSEIALDATVVAVVAGLAFAVGVVIGVIPAVHVFGADLGAVFHGEGRTGTTGRATRIWRKCLVAAQLGLALVLLLGAGLLLESFRQVLAVAPGFSPSRVLTAMVSLPSTRYRDDASRRAFMARALEAIRSMPGVEQAGATDTIPFSGRSSDSVIIPEGYVMRPGESMVSPNQMVVTPGYFEAMKIPLLEGRLFDARDKEDSQRVLVIDNRLARRFWQGGSPVGKRMWRPTSARGLTDPKEREWLTVVGVVRAVKLRALVDPDERVGAYYFPYLQNSSSVIAFTMRLSGEPQSAVGSLRAAVAAIDPELPVYDAHPMQERIDRSLIVRRLPMLVAVGFGAIALLLAAVGIYGVLTYMVAQRTREIGIRMALGSTAQGVFKLVLREGALILGAGFGLGVAGAVGLARYVESVLYGVRPLDPRVLASAAAVLGAVALLATVLPARRATRVDPVVALRQE